MTFVIEGDHRRSGRLPAGFNWGNKETAKLLGYPIVRQR